MSELTKCNHDYCYHEYIGLAGVKCLKCENKQLKEHLAAAHEALADWKRIADAETDRRAEWERVARSRPMVIDNQEAGLEIERLRVRLAAAEAAIKAQEEEAARTHDAWGEEVNDYATRLAAAEATIERLSRGILNAAGWRECEGDPLGKSNEDLAS